jgi:hypothetical protein
MFSLQPPRHIPTLPTARISPNEGYGPYHRIGPIADLKQAGALTAASIKHDGFRVIARKHGKQVKLSRLDRSPSWGPRYRRL